MADSLEELQRLLFQQLLANELLSRRLTPVTQERMQFSLTMVEGNNQNTLRVSEMLQIRQPLTQAIRQEVMRDVLRQEVARDVLRQEVARDVLRQEAARDVRRQPQVENRSLKSENILKELVRQIANEASKSKPEEKPETTKKLNLEELKHVIGSKIADLGEYNPKKVLESLNLFGSALIEYPNERKQIADYMAELGYASVIKEQMGHFSVLDVLNSDEARLLTDCAIRLCLNLSAHSADFAKKLASAEAVELLTQIVINEEYLANKSNAEIVSLISKTVDVLNNIARYEPIKTCFTQQNTVQALIELLTWNNGCLKERAMLTLALIMDGDHLLALTDDNDIIKNLIVWLNKACDNKDERSHDGFSPLEIVESLTKLAANDFNKAKIIMAGGLQALTKMLCYSDPIEQISSAECVMMIAMDANLRPTIIKVTELLSALLELLESSNERVQFQGCCTLLVLADQSYLQESNTLSQEPGTLHQQQSSSSPSPDLTALPQQLPCHEVTPHDVTDFPTHDETHLKQYVSSASPTPTSSSQHAFLTPQQFSHPPQLCSSSDPLGRFPTLSPKTNTTPSPRPNTAPSPKTNATPSPRPNTTPSPRPNTTTSPKPNTTPSPKPNTTPSPRPTTTPSPRPNTTPSPRTVTASACSPVAIQAVSPVTTTSHNQLPLPTQVEDPSTEDPVDDTMESLVDPQFVTDYLMFRGVFSRDDPVVQDILGISNHLEQREALLDHVLQNDGYKIYIEALVYNKVYVLNFKTIIQSSLGDAQFKDGIYTNIPWNLVEEMLSNLTWKLNEKGDYTPIESYGYQYCLTLVKLIFSFDIGEKIGNYLKDLYYSETAKNIISRINIVDVLERSNCFALTSTTLNTCIAYSDVSKTFVKCLVDAGLIESLTGYLTDECYRSNLEDESVLAIVTDFLTLLYNIAYHLDTKESFRDFKTIEAIQNISVKNEKIEITVVLTLQYLLNEQELDNLPDVSKVIENIIKYMSGALNKQTRRYSGMSLCELSKGLTVLAVKKSNRLKIASQDEAVAVLAKMFRHSDAREHISSARCLQALAAENSIRKKLLEFPDLVLAMEEVQKSGSLNVKKCVEDALAQLRKINEEDSVAELEHSEGPVSIDGQANAQMPQMASNDHFNSEAGDLQGAVQQIVRSVSQMSSQQGNNSIQSQPFNFYLMHKTKTVINKVKTVVQKEEKKFTARGKSEKLRPEDEETLKRHWGLLVNELDATHIIMELISYEVFDVDDKREILGHSARRERTEIMLQKLLNAGPGPAFKRFLDVLEKDHSHILDKMREWAHER